MPGAVLPASVDKIMRRVQSLTRTSAPMECMSDGQGSKVLRKSKSGRLFSALGVRRTKSLSRMDSLPSDVPQGCLPVYVGAERKRFVISMKHLSHPLFKAILKRSEEEFGFNHRGGLSIACDPPMFEHLLWVISSGSPATHKDEKLDTFLDLYSW